MSKLPNHIYQVEDQLMNENPNWHIFSPERQTAILNSRVQSLLWEEVVRLRGILEPQAIGGDNLTEPSREGENTSEQ